MRCPKKTTVPALWLLPFNSVLPVLRRGWVEYFGNYGSKELRVCSVVPFEGELEEGKDGRCPRLWEGRQDPSCETTPGYERYGLRSSPLPQVSEGLLGDRGVVREREPGEDRKGGGVPLRGSRRNEFVCWDTWDGSGHSIYLMKSSRESVRHLFVCPIRGIHPGEKYNRREPGRLDETE